MSDRFNLATAVAVLALFGATSAMAAKKTEKPPAEEENPACPKKQSKAYQKTLEGMQKAKESENWQEVVNKAAEANAQTDEKSEWEKYLLLEGAAIAHARLKQYAEAKKDFEGSYNSPCFPMKDAALKDQREKILFQLSYQTKDFDSAIKYGQAYYDRTGNTDTGLYLANAYYIKDDYPNTKKTMSDVIAKMEAAGQTPEESAYRILQSSCLQLKDNDCVVALIEKLVEKHPKPEYWQNLIGAMLQVSKSDKELLNVLRLADGIGVMQTASEYLEMANYAMGQGLPGEAQAIIEKGAAKGAYSKKSDADKANRQLADAKNAVTLDKSTLDKQDASARAKPTGDADVKLGAAYLSYGMNDKAIEALERGIAKGGVKDPDEAGMLLGIAYLRSGKKPEAAKAFGTVNKSPMMTRIAKFWMLKTDDAAG